MLDILLGVDLICEYERVYAPSSCGLRSLSTAFDMSFVLLLQLKSITHRRIEPNCRNVAMRVAHRKAVTVKSHKSS